MKKIILTVVLVAVVVASYMLNVGEVLPGYMASKYLEIRSVASGVFSNVSSFINLKSQIVAENSRLKNELNNLRFAKINLLSARADLSELSGLDLQEDKQYALARIFPVFLHKTKQIRLYVESPEKLEGVTDVYAYGPGGFVLGKVAGSGVNKKSYILELFSAPDVSTPAKLIIDNDKKVSVTLYGRGGFSYRFELNKEYSVKEGDTVFYAGHPLAQVIKVIDNEKSPYYSVFATVPFNVQNLDFLKVSGLWQY